MGKLTEEELTMHKLLDEHKYALLSSDNGKREARCVICGEAAPDYVVQSLVFQAVETDIYAGLSQTTASSDADSGVTLTEEMIKQTYDALFNDPKI